MSSTLEERDFIVQADRTLRPIYSEWMKLVIFPEWEGTGPAEYDLRKDVWCFYHDDQRHGTIGLDTLFFYLLDTEILTYCLGLADLQAIRSKGPTLFSELYAGKTIYAWKSLVRDLYDNSLRVPSLWMSQARGPLSLEWTTVVANVHVGRDSPALRFR